jgi:hypothetical protein
MGRAIAVSGIKPVIDKIFPFDEAQAATGHGLGSAFWQNRYPRRVSRFSFPTPGGPGIGGGTALED